MDKNSQQDTQRIEMLKRVLRELHEGKSIDQINAEYGQLLAGVDALEVSTLEQILLDEGVPEQEITALCDLHVDAFKYGLSQQMEPKLSPNASINAYMVENAAVVKILDQMQTAISNCDWESAQQLLNGLQKFNNHYLRKENILFPYLERHQFTGPSKVMWSIHDAIRKGWKDLGRRLSDHPELSQVNEVFQPLAKTMRDMVYKEEKILFPAALQMLNDQEWKAIRTQESEPGFASYAPAEPTVESTNPPTLGNKPALDEISRVIPETKSGGTSPIPLSIGSLTTEQINLLLTHLPVDVTFVDEKDEVCYYSATPQRIFHRTPAIIGRKVQNCHPASSVPKVQHILDEFRAGKRDIADFWIQMGPDGEKKFVYIRYFAIRDEEGRYCGTLEVSQDVTNIRALEGERRLDQDEA